MNDAEMPPAPELASLPSEEGDDDPGQRILEHGLMADRAAGMSSGSWLGETRSTDKCVR